MTTTSKDEDRIETCEEALHALLTALFAHRSAKASVEPLRTISPASVRWHRDIGELPSREDSAIAALVVDPIDAACRQAVRRVGQRLHDLGGFDAMSTAADRMAERDPVRAGRRASLLNHAWDGIGSWHA